MSQNDVIVETIVKHPAIIQPIYMIRLQNKLAILEQRWTAPRHCFRTGSVRHCCIRRVHCISSVSVARRGLYLSMSLLGML